MVTGILGGGFSPNLIYLYIYIYGLYGCQPKNNGCQHPPNHPSITHRVWNHEIFTLSILGGSFPHYFWFNTKIRDRKPYLLGIFGAPSCSIHRWCAQSILVKRWSSVQWPCLGMMNSYPIIWGLFHKPWNVGIPFLNNQYFMESKRAFFRCSIVEETML